MSASELPPEIKLEILETAKMFGPMEIINGLEDIIIRHKSILMTEKLDDDTKFIVKHELSILVAATAGYQTAMENMSKSIKKSSKK